MKKGSKEKQTEEAIEPPARGNGGDRWAMRTFSCTPGRLWLITRGERLWGAEFEPRWAHLEYRLFKLHGIACGAGRVKEPSRPVLTRACSALGRYFEGDFAALEDIELDLEGSALQKRVWTALGRVEAGRTITYAQLATRARQTGAFRAVGAANGANPCAIFVPCHRVVSTAGELTGYGGGIDVKSWLLAHEGVENDGERITRS